MQDCGNYVTTRVQSEGTPPSRFILSRFCPYLRFTHHAPIDQAGLLNVKGTEFGL